MAISSNDDIADFASAELAGDDRSDAVEAPASVAGGGIWALCRKRVAGYVEIVRAFEDETRARADLSGVDLRPLKLMAYLNLPGLKARETTFYGLDMTAIMLQGANLEGADLRGAKLQGADLRGINLTNARLSGADLRDCNMQPLVIDSERRLPVQLTGANLTGADLRGTDISQAVHEGAILEDACTDDDEVAAGG